MNKLFIVDIKKTHSNVTHFKLSNGEFYDYATIVNMVEKGEIANVRVERLENGLKVLNYNQDTLQGNDLYNVVR